MFHNNDDFVQLGQPLDITTIWDLQDSHSEGFIPTRVKYTSGLDMLLQKIL